MSVRRVLASAAAVLLLLGLADAGSSASATEKSTPPTIVEQPQSVTAKLGHTAHFRVKATGKPRPTVQWQVSTGGGPFINTGMPAAHLSVPATFADDGAHYHAVVSNGSGSVTSQTVSLSVDQSAYVGTYTLHQQLGTFVTSGTLTLEPDGAASDGVTLDFVFWSAAGRQVTVRIGNDAFEVITLTGNLTGYGIASPKHPGAAVLSINGSIALTGTFYAQRIS
jgi:predicted DNA-binding protein with PD1-like motif